jgi:hypothetical protein
LVTYVVTGVEPDLSEITVPLAPAEPDANYAVFPATQGAAAIVGMDINTKTTVSFRVSCTGNLTAGDPIAFLLVR